MELLERNGVSELSVNRPGEVWIEVGDTMQRHEVPQLTLEHLKQFARLAAQYTEQLISEEHPLLSGTLPGGYRVQIVYPPAVEPGTIGLSIRRQTIRDMALRDWTAAACRQPPDDRPSESANRLAELQAQGQYVSLIETAVRARKNILISGGTSSGKTTFLNACLKHISTFLRTSES